MQREQALRQKAEVDKTRLERVLVGIKDQFIAPDREWRYTFIKDQVTAVTGKQKEELLGKIIWEVFPEVVGSTFAIQTHRAIAEQTATRFECKQNSQFKYEP